MGGGVVDRETADDVGSGARVDAEKLESGGGVGERLIIIRVTNAVGSTNCLRNDLRLAGIALGGGSDQLGSGLVEIEGSPAPDREPFAPVGTNRFDQIHAAHEANLGSS